MCIPHTLHANQLCVIKVENYDVQSKISKKKH